MSRVLKLLCLLCGLLSLNSFSQADLNDALGDVEITPEMMKEAMKELKKSGLVEDADLKTLEKAISGNARPQDVEKVQKKLLKKQEFLRNAADSMTEKKLSTKDETDIYTPSLNNQSEKKEIDKDYNSDNSREEYLRQGLDYLNSN